MRTNVSQKLGKLALSHPGSFDLDTIEALLAKVTDWSSVIAASSWGVAAARAGVV
jgi:hypothetical protein